MFATLQQNASSYTSLNESERLAVSHMCAALDLLSSLPSGSSPSLGVVAGLLPLHAKVKRFMSGSTPQKSAAGGGPSSPHSPSSSPRKKSLLQSFSSFSDSVSFDGSDEQQAALSPEDRSLVRRIKGHFSSLATAAAAGSSNPPDLHAAFAALDRSKTGQLSSSSLRAALAKVNLNLDDGELSRVLTLLDVDGDGSVNYMEFLRFCGVGEGKHSVAGGKVPSTSKIEDAITHVSRAIFLINDHVLFNLRAECYFKLHDLKSCVSNLRYVLKLLPGDQETRIRLAKVLDLQGINWLKSKNYAAANICFAESCKLDPIRSCYWVHKSVSLIHTSSFSDALRAVDQAMGVEKATASVLCLRGKLHWALDLTDAGNRDFRAAQDLEPEHPEVVAFATAMIDKSAAIYKKAMEKMQAIDGKEADVKEAISLLTQAISLVPDDMRLLILRAKAYRSIGELEASLSDIDDAVFAYCQSMMGSDVPKFVPNRRLWIERQSLLSNYREPNILTDQRSLTLNECAMVKMKEGEYQRAISLLNRVIEQEFNMHGKDMSKVNAKYFVNRGDCYRATGHIEQAMSDFHRAYDSDPTNWQTKTRLSMIHYMAGLQLFNEGFYSQAENELTTAINYNNKVSQYYACRGKAAYYQNNYNGAFQDYKEALRLDPNNADMLMRMQQFDPERTVVESMKNGNASLARSLSKGRITLGGGLPGPSANGHGRATHSAPAQLLSQTADLSVGFLPKLTPVTAVNKHLRSAAVVKDFVQSKRNVMAAQLSVNERRVGHPLKKDALWKLLEPKPVEYKSLRRPAEPNPKPNKKSARPGGQL